MERKAEICLIEVDSQFDPGSHMQCCGEEAMQYFVGYRITVGGQRFGIPEVWASVCKKDGKTYFDSVVGDTIFQKMSDFLSPNQDL